MKVLIRLTWDRTMLVQIPNQASAPGARIMHYYFLNTSFSVTRCPDSKVPVVDTVI